MQRGRELLLPHVRYMTYTWTRPGGVFVRKAVALVMEHTAQRRTPVQLEHYKGRVQPEHLYPARHTFYLPRVRGGLALPVGVSRVSHVSSEIARVLQQQLARLGQV